MSYKNSRPPKLIIFAAISSVLLAGFLSEKVDAVCNDFGCINNSNSLFERLPKPAPGPLSAHQHLSSALGLDFGAPSASHYLKRRCEDHQDCPPFSECVGYPGTCVRCLRLLRGGAYCPQSGLLMVGRQPRNPFHPRRYPMLNCPQSEQQRLSNQLTSLLFHLQKDVKEILRRVTQNLPFNPPAPPLLPQDLLEILEELPKYLVESALRFMDENELLSGDLDAFKGLIDSHLQELERPLDQENNPKEVTEIYSDPFEANEKSVGQNLESEKSSVNLPEERDDPAQVSGFSLESSSTNSPMALQSTTSARPAETTTLPVTETYDAGLMRTAADLSEILSNFVFPTGMPGPTKRLEKFVPNEASNLVQPSPTHPAELSSETALFTPTTGAKNLESSNDPGFSRQSVTPQNLFPIFHGSTFKEASSDSDPMVMTTSPSDPPDPTVVFTSELKPSTTEGNWETFQYSSGYETELITVAPYYLSESASSTSKYQPEVTTTAPEVLTTNTDYQPLVSTTTTGFDPDFLTSTDEYLLEMSTSANGLVPDLSAGRSSRKYKLPTTSHAAYQSELPAITPTMPKDLKTVLAFEDPYPTEISRSTADPITSTTQVAEQTKASPQTPMSTTASPAKEHSQEVSVLGELTTNATPSPALNYTIDEELATEVAEQLAKIVGKSESQNANDFKASKCTDNTDCPSQQRCYPICPKCLFGFCYPAEDFEALNKDSKSVNEEHSNKKSG